jgi:hypothetical protein
VGSKQNEQTDPLNPEIINRLDNMYEYNEIIDPMKYYRNVDGFEGLYDDNNIKRSSSSNSSKKSTDTTTTTTTTNNNNNNNNATASSNGSSIEGYNVDNAITNNHSTSASPLESVSVIPNDSEYDTNMNSILQWYKDHYKHESEGASILFPIGALKCLKKLCNISNNRLIVLSGDKGNNNTEQFIGLSDPHIAVVSEDYCNMMIMMMLLL